MEISGKIEKIYCDKTNWASVRISEAPQKELTAIGFPLSRTTFTASGKILNPVVGTRINMTGKWVEDKKFGTQFKVDYCELLNSDAETVYAYLTSGFVKGIGDKTAHKIMDKFGPDTIDVIIHDWTKLEQISGISEDKALKIHTAVMESERFVTIMKLFHGDITKNKVEKIVETYKDEAMKIIKDNPYQLIYDIRGFGFLTVDKLAISTGIALDDPRRIKACICYTLDQVSQNQGHCYINIEDVASNIQSLIKNINIDNKIIVDQIAELQKDGYLICEPTKHTVRVYLKELYDAESNLAKKISTLKSMKTPLVYNKDIVEASIEYIEATDNILFEPLQKEAVLRSMRNHISIITGGPGTGKSTIIKALTYAGDTLKMNLVLLAPTGRASRRLAQATDQEAKTICKFNYITCGTLDNTLFVIDEASMVDIEDASKLLSHVGMNSIIVLVGDTDQLPSIGAGNFFRDLVKSQIVPLTKLEITHRFTGTIAKNAHAINAGSCKLVEGDDFKIINTTDPLKRQEFVLQEYYKELSEAKGDFRKLQIIVPMRQRGETSSNVLNEIIREKVNPLNGRSSFGKNKFRERDRVMQIKNNSKLGVANGDCGIVTKIDLFNKKMEVRMDVGGIVEYDSDTVNELVIAYAITVHKSQGSEYMTVISAYGSSDYMMLQRNLLYTAVTRAKKKMIIVADSRSIYKAVNNIQPIIRNTALIERIQINDKSALASK